MSTQKDYWPAIRAKNFLAYLNERGYTDFEPSTYKNNMAILASHAAVELDDMAHMNPVTFGKKVFLPQHAEATLVRLLGINTYSLMLEIHISQQAYLHDLKRKCPMLTAEDQALVKQMMSLAC
jgi:hypothetical protein